MKNKCIALFLLYFAVFFISCKSVPQAPAKESPQETSTSEGASVSLETPVFENGAADAHDAQADTESSESLLPEVQPALSDEPSKPSEQAKTDEKPPMTLKPKTLPLSKIPEKTAKPQERVKPSLSLKPKSSVQSLKSSAPEPSSEPLSSDKKENENAENIKPATEESSNTVPDTENTAVFEEPKVVLDTADFTDTEERTGGSVQIEEPVEPSRVEEVKLNQTFDIVYEGKSWMFLGEAKPAASPVVTFSKRVFSGKNTVFSLNAVSEGETLLHFYKHDLIENVPIDEYVLVRVGTAEKEDKAADTLSDRIDIPVPDVPVLPDDDKGKIYAGLSAEELYMRAENAFNENRYTEAVEILDGFFKTFTPPESCFDKALFLKARIYESPSDYRNIRSALDEYKKITAFFPESGLWNAAQQRIIYINRFYMEIR